MSTMITATELRTMPTDDLVREVRAQRSIVSKMRLGIELKKEKDSARFRRERRALARMVSILSEKSREQSQKKPKEALRKTKPSPTVSAS